MALEVLTVHTQLKAVFFLLKCQKPKNSSRSPFVVSPPKSQGGLSSASPGPYVLCCSFKVRSWKSTLGQNLNV